MVIKKPAIPPLNTFNLYRAGRSALNEVPNLRQSAFKGFLINLVIYFCLISLAGFTYYSLIHVPLSDWTARLDPGWIQTSLSIGLWILLVIAVLIAALLSIRISLKFMGFWYSDLSAKVVQHMRGPIRMPSFMEELPFILRDVARETAISVGLIILGLVPLIGAPTVLLIGAWLQGRAIVLPYKEVLRGANLTITDESPTQKLLLGSGQILLALIPVIGWFLLPVVNLYQVLGYTWLKEQMAQVSSDQDAQVPEPAVVTEEPDPASDSPLDETTRQPDKEPTTKA